MAKKGQYKKNAKPASVAKRKYNQKPEQKKNRAKRNAARRQAMKEGKVRKGDGKDIDHKKKLKDGGGNGKGNLRVRDKSKNRADNGKTGGRPKGSKNKKGKK